MAFISTSGLMKVYFFYYFPSLPCGHLYCPQMLFVVRMRVSEHIRKATSYHHNHQRVSNRGTPPLVAPLFRQKTHDKRNRPYRNQNCDKRIASAGVLKEETNTSRAYKYYISTLATTYHFLL
eukprot:UN03646